MGALSRDCAKLLKLTVSLNETDQFERISYLVNRISLVEADYVGD
jgi:hypothetical protein